ncbi:hypothetical protein FDG57_gp086 [Mycobacterium phage Mutaforma13]|uniref:Uncharacterized protein n=1 Tax=Mycobacterium phage Mutaforma13 TaxID=2922219 RepID=G1DUH4_9CAUD|nr:hypothetical protein FDG57_gp086 [Mycobacterium phage Mutaforma13]AEJ93161.1 hypothetical protein MUTAFORMA13_86 [Mycobacterium phage Mutaforma13]
MSSEAQNVIAEALRGHEYNGASCGAEYPRHEFCTCGWSGPGESAHEQHQAEEIDKALGGLRPEYIARHESGGGTIHGTRVNAEIAMRSYVVFPPGVDDPGSGRLTGIESRWVSGWSEA